MLIVNELGYEVRAGYNDITVAVLQRIIICLVIVASPANFPPQLSLEDHSVKKSVQLSGILI